ncbi:MAG: hypothetical protein DI544_03890 [Sphingomonas taxi]|uniref:histidine kinase n=1 Tax=Sphingomonas taxi TaxID=1549858 RepID=A0A2W5PG35_9SPHN|nr:MAG: hypothetical protein DI544_03890 [Sphingomonas taxi]
MLALAFRMAPPYSGSMSDMLQQASGKDRERWLAGESDMGRRIARHDWARSPIGSLSRWPQPLRTLVDVLVNSTQPMFVAWGPHRVLLYNDAYAGILAGKHPAALGQDFLDVWDEIRADLAPIVDAAYAGRAVHMDDIELMMNRRGFPERTHFAFSYTPVNGEDGEVAGFFCPCNEITGQVLGERRLRFQARLDERLHPLDDLEALVVAASELLAAEIEVPHVAYARIDAGQRYMLVKGEWGDAGIAPLKGRYAFDALVPGFVDALRAGRPVIVPDTAAEPAADASAFHRGAGAFLAVPITKDAEVVATVLVHASGRRIWSEADIDIARDMAGRVWSALARARAQTAAKETSERYRVAALATNDAIWDWDLQNNSVLWNEALFVTHRFVPGDVEPTGDWWIDHIHPDDRERVDMSIHAVIDSDKEHWAESYRFRRGDGSYADVLDRGYVVRDRQGVAVRMIGAMLDITEQKRIDAALRAGEERLSFALDAGGLGAWELDLQTGELTTSTHCRENFGKPGNAPFSYADLLATIHPEDRARQQEAVERAIAGQHDLNIDYRVVWPDGQTRWINVRGRPAFDETGQPVLIAGVSLDVTHRTLADQHQRLLIDELNHRVKNTLATIQSIAMQTFRHEDGVGAPPEQRDLFESRLMALAKVHDVLTRENWEGARLRDVVLEAVAAHCGGDQAAFTVQGPDARLAPRIALSLSMALHELCTNAAKYGALSVADGQVSIRWVVEQAGDGRCLRLVWREQGGPAVRTPSRKGFGSRLIERQLGRELRGTVELRFEPTGVICTINAPVADPGTIAPATLPSVK